MKKSTMTDIDQPDEIRRDTPTLTGSSCQAAANWSTKRTLITTRASARMRARRIDASMTMTMMAVEVVVAVVRVGGCGAGKMVAVHA